LSDADLEAQACALTTAVDSRELKSFLGAETAMSCASRR
jgi:hypothetical protein